MLAYKDGKYVEILEDIAEDIIPDIPESMEEKVEKLGEAVDKLRERFEPLLRLLDRS